MAYEEFRNLKAGQPCVIIHTGEPGKAIEINRHTQEVLILARRAGAGVVKEWFNYTQLARI